jgi:NAD(P)-dependent dehydrogenase (short-subunit alcohol dehydrogenase family)
MSEMPDTQQQPTPPFPPQHQPKPGIEQQMQPRPEYQAPLYRAAGKLRGKVALVTGGDSGIGRAVAVLYAREGARAIENEGGRALLISGDITEPAFSEQAVERTVREFGKLDILVNNAAFQQHHASIEELSDEQWDHTFKTNIYGYFRMAKAALKRLGPGGAIVNTGSITGLEGSKELLDYSATKGAIHAFTKSLAQNVQQRGIRVNCVAPGPVWTPLNVSDKEPEQVKTFGEQVPMKRPAQPEEIAPAYVFLAAPSCSSYITGEILPIIGGYSGG